MRILVQTSDFVAVGFNVPIAELLTGRDSARHEELNALGPDLLAPTFDAAEVLRRMRAHDGDAIADALLNQRVVAGIGNVFKSEILFIAGIDPFQAVGALSDDDLMRIVEESRTQLRANVLDRSQTLSPGLRPPDDAQSGSASATLWVYGRGGKAVQNVRHADSGTEDRPRRATHVLVSTVPAVPVRLKDVKKTVVRSLIADLFTRSDGRTPRASRTSAPVKVQADLPVHAGRLVAGPGDVVHIGSRIGMGLSFVRQGPALAGPQPDRGYPQTGATIGTTFAPSDHALGQTGPSEDLRLSRSPSIFLDLLHIRPSAALHESGIGRLGLDAI